ncbi:MAG: ABC transporter ATP-binding protein [Zwartia sp.]
MIKISNVSKTYATGFSALTNINLEVRQGEIFALLGPNGAGKTTLISLVCGIVTPSTGTVTIDGFDHIKQYREARARVGLVPQEISTDMFETVWNTVSFSRGLFGKPANPAWIEKTLKDLSLWDKKDSKIIRLSGGMKRRVMIAKALSHEPRVLFLDEPTAGVDVSLRRDMWQLVKALKQTGVTIILTTHYIEEAEEMADRIGIITKGQILLVEETSQLMKKLGKKELVLQLTSPLNAIPAALSHFDLLIASEGHELIYTYDVTSDEFGITELLSRLNQADIHFKDLHTNESSLEDIFVSLTSSNVE